MRRLEIVKFRNLWLAISLFLLVPGLISLLLNGLKLGIDFTGGTLMELSFPKPVTAQVVQQALKKTPIESPVVQILDGGKAALIRAKAINNKEQIAINDTLKSELGTFTTERMEVVGPTIGKELFANSLWAILLVIGGIIGYLSFRFRFDYALCAILTLMHDVFIVIGLFSIFGALWGTEVDSLFVTAVLTVAGFSTHDTIVVFDRIRENAMLAAKKGGKPFSEIADDAINQTLVRSVNTSLTTMLTLLALFLFGGASTRDFVLAMLLGIGIGTYSSIFFASPVLAWWRDRGRKTTKARPA